MDLGTTIKNIRKRKKFTQVNFANKCGITQTYLSQLERNQKEPNLSTLKAISNALNIPLPIIFFLSMDEKDVSLGKREAFNLINSSVKSLIHDTFEI